MAGLALSAALALATTASAERPQLLEFAVMAPVTGPYVGGANPIRGINGGGVPWQIASAKGELSTSGKLEVRVTGLVLAAGPLAGTNPVQTFRATVSCQSIGPGGAATVVNRTTDAFPATTGPAALGGGNARIEAMIDLPHPCIGPIVFVVNGANGAWFAATGAQ
jgi:hypothetical protein